MYNQCLSESGPFSFPVRSWTEKKQGMNRKKQVLTRKGILFAREIEKNYKNKLRKSLANAGRKGLF